MKNIITVQRPNLTAEEREKRLNQIKEAAARLVLAAEKERSAKT